MCVSYNDRVEKERHDNTTKRMMFLAVEVGLIFAIPAILVGILGPKIDVIQGTEKMWTVITLVAGLVLSWSIVIWKYKKAMREIRERKQNGLTSD